MDKSRFLIVMLLFTITGVAMTTLGLNSLPSDSSRSFIQSWFYLLDERPVFGGVVVFYLSVVLLCDAWAAFGLFRLAQGSFNKLFLKTKGRNWKFRIQDLISKWRLS
jgi:hypothetical protein